MCTSQHWVSEKSLAGWIPEDVRQEEPRCLGVGPGLSPLLELAFSLPQVLESRDPKPVSCVLWS